MKRLKSVKPGKEHYLADKYLDPFSHRRVENSRFKEIQQIRHNLN